mmetsp:Transcript_107674/g.273423  ORF Transcript_107674/g.273423 Transcript_107674/m.273423 type:complete len:519 (-) Transcript_107674:62-1618(-)
MAEVGVAADPLQIFLAFDPDTQLPSNFAWDPKARPIKIAGDKTIVELTQAVKGVISAHCFDNGFAEFDLIVNVAWNSKSDKPVRPQNTVASEFEDGDTICVIAEMWKAKECVATESSKLPVTILTGFLGAGKTTLLNYILQEQRGKKIAIIENEFGEVSIDDDLLKMNKFALAEEVVVMDNGCMCCTVRGDLEKGLRQIITQRRKGKHIDAILIETTGMADPVPIARTFMVSNDLTDELRLDGIVTVADAKHILARLDDEVEEGKVNEAWQQVAFADKILLNKLDLVTKDVAAAVKARLRSINSFAKILPTVQSKVDLEELSNIHAHDIRRFAEEDFEQEAGEDGGHGTAEGHEHGGHGHAEDCSDEHGTGDGYGGSHGHEAGHGEGHASSGQKHGSEHGQAQGHGHSTDSRHDSRVNSIGFTQVGEVDWDELMEWMRYLGTLDKSFGTIYRIKAIFAVKGWPQKYVFHAVMDVISKGDAGEWADGERKVCKAVFIGKSLDRQAIRKSFESLFKTSEP